MSLRGFSTKSRKIQRKKKTRFAVASGILVSAMLLTTGFTGTGYTRSNADAAKPAYRQVTIDVDGKTITTKTARQNPENILARAGVTLWQGDDYEVQKNDAGDSHIIIHRSVPVTVTYEGRTKQIQTNKATVKDALVEAGYNLDDYEVATGLNTKIKRNMDIELTDSAAVREAKAAAERERQKTMVQTSSGAHRYTNVITMEASAYLPSDGGGSGITAYGIPARYGVVAVDPNVIPLGTRVYIPGYGEAIAADTGGAIRGNKIDLCMEDYDSAMQFGRRDIQVYVLE